MTERIDVVVIGAGVVGLATGRALARAGRDVVVLEQHDAIGSETSSRNSEVIHAGIYYRLGGFVRGSVLKAKSSFTHSATTMASAIRDAKS